MSEQMVKRLAMMSRADREGQKKRLLKLYDDANKISPADAKAELKRIAEKERWERAREGWNISRRELRQRVRSLRDELESYHAQIQAVPFDIPTGDFNIPDCLDGEKRKYHVELIEDFNPFIKGIFEMIDTVAKEHGCNEAIDFNAKLFSLKSECARTGFQIGVLAGVIFAAGSKDQVDKFERGLTFALSSLVKE